MTTGFSADSPSCSFVTSVVKVLVFSVFSQCLRITNPKFPRFLRKFFIEIKFFSAPPRLRGATGFSGFSPCLRASVVGFAFWLRLGCAVPLWWVWSLVVALLYCGEFFPLRP